MRVGHLGAENGGRGRPFLPAPALLSTSPEPFASLAFGAASAMLASAGDILTHKGTDVVTARPQETVFACIARMVDHNVGSVLVVNSDRQVVGIFTERDYLRRIALEGRSSRTTAVEAVMTRDVIAVSPSRSVNECLSIMTQAKCRHLPVVQEGDLLGIVSIGDCVKQRSEAALQEVDHLETYIQRFIMSRYPA